MDYTSGIILFGSLLVLLSIVASALSARLGAPVLLVFLVLGMVAGEEGPGGVDFDDWHAARLVGSIALAIIILDGGLRTRREAFRVALWPAVSLATVGVVVTASIVGAVASWLLGVHWMYGLLLGAIIGSTDAAAVFGLLHTAGLELKQRVGATLEIESGSNDPMAIFLTVTLVALLSAGEPKLSWEVAGRLFAQLAIGGSVGWVGGRLLGALINRLRLATALYPLLTAAGGLLVFAVAAVLGGSGFLSIYLCGIVLGNMPLRASQSILRMHDGLAWLSQIAMFLMLGLLVTPSELVDVIGEGLLIAVVLILVARPAAVFLSLLPFRFPWREQAFIGWVGLRGAVPIILAIFPLTAGLPFAREFFNLAFFVVLASLLIQGWTIAPLARRLGLEVPPTAEPTQRINLDIPGHLEREVVCYEVLPGSTAANNLLANLPLPEGSHITTLIRDDAVVAVHDGHLVLMPGDLVYVFTDPDRLPQLNRIFDPHRVPDRLEEHRYYGEFVLNGAATLGDICDAYGLAVDGSARDRTVAEHFRLAFRGRPVVGDRTPLGTAELVVRQVAGSEVATAGVRLRRDRHRPG
jgi:potassium/hydrogen antiporter